MGVLNVDGVAGFAANDYGGTVFVLLVDESALNAGLARGAPESTTTSPDGYAYSEPHLCLLKALVDHDTFVR